MVYGGTSGNAAVSDKNFIKTVVPWYNKKENKN